MTDMNSSTELKQTYRYRKQIFGCQGGVGERAGSGRLGLADADYYKQTGQIARPAVQHRGFIQCPVISHNGKESPGELSLTVSRPRGRQYTYLLDSSIKGCVAMNQGRRQ